MTNIWNVFKLYEDIYMYEYESGTFVCTRCAKEFLTKHEAEKHHKPTHLEEESLAVE